MAVLTPSTTTGGNLEDWKRGFEAATYQKMLLIPIVDDYGGRIYGLGHVRKYARVTGSVLAQSSEGTGLTYLTILGTPVSITPVGSVVPIAWSENEESQIDVSLDSDARSELEASLAELTESNVASQFATATQFMSAAGVDAAMLRQGMARLVGNSNGKAMPGQDTDIYGWFSHTQLPNLMNIEEVNRADARGDSENPFVKGIWVKGYGFLLVVSTVVYQDVNGWHNALFLKEALITGWNKRSMITSQLDELQHRLICYNNMGSAVLHDSRIEALRTTASGL